jgi:calcineurin-like phosphoesterase family protein
MNRKFDFFTADWHLGENRFAIMQRPFKTVKEGNDELVRRHNEVVRPNDRVLVIGDAVYKAAPECLPLVAKFNGVKTLIRGNHDALPDSILLHYFEEIIPEGEGIDFEVEGVPCHATHYPTLGVKDRFNLVGHIHGAWKYQLNMLNVGVDANHFAPHHMSQVPFYLKAVTEFYDADVWSAYHAANVSHYDTRGKKTSYFPPNPA